MNDASDIMVERARAIAIIGHFGQFRHDGTTPYIKHPEDVANRCSNNNERCVGWLHDILEDTSVSADALRQVFPEHIVEAVVAITKASGWLSEAEYIEAILTSPLAATVKLYDMASNLADKPTAKQVERYNRMTDILITRMANGS